MHYLPKAKVTARWHDPAKTFVEPPADIQELLMFTRHDIVGKNDLFKDKSMIKHLATYMYALDPDVPQIEEETEEEAIAACTSIIRNVKIGVHNTYVNPLVDYLDKEQ